MGGGIYYNKQKRKLNSFTIFCNNNVSKRLEKGLFPDIVECVSFSTCQDVSLLYQPSHPIGKRSASAPPLWECSTWRMSGAEIHKVLLYQQLGRNAHVFVSGKVRNGNKCKNMLFWQLIFNTEMESTRQLCFVFFLGGGLLLIFCFLVFARKKLTHFPPTPHPLSQAEISLRSYF